MPDPRTGSHPAAITDEDAAPIWAPNNMKARVWGSCGQEAWNVATTVYQSVGVPSVAAPVCGPVSAEVMSCS